MTADRLEPARLEEFRRLSSCVVAGAIETFRVRMPNTGFADSAIKCIFEDRLPKVPAVAREILQRRHYLVGLCGSAGFSVGALRDAIKDADLKS